MRTTLRRVSLCVGVLAACAGPAAGVVVHPGDDAGPGAALKPNEAVLGRFNGSSAVAVGPEHFVATAHQGAASTVNFGGVDYAVSGVTPHATADLVVGRITGGTLPQYAPVYTATDEVTQVVTVGGFGRTRGSTLTDPTFGDYAYAWGTTGLQWGRNRIDGTAPASAADPNDSNPSDLLLADFDARGALTSVDFEAAMAQFDSGGGWFVLDDGTWYVAGLNRAVERGDQSRFEDPTTGLPDPDELAAVRLSSYAGFISANVPEPSSVGALVAAVAFTALRRGRRRAP
jgi:hypothetical protein